MLKKKIISGILTMVTLLIIVSTLSVSAVAQDAIKYTNSTLNFSLTLPSSWAGRFKVNKDENGVNFVSLRNEKAGYGGLLFGIEVHNKETDFPSEYTELLRAGGKYFYVVYPGDIPFAYEDASLTKEYNDMRKDIETILKTFRYTGK